MLSSFDSAAQPRQRENERPSFSLGISPPASQLTQPSQESVSQLEILAEVVVDAGVTAALKFAKATTSDPTLPAAEVFKTPEKKIKISKDLIEKCYHWMTHVKKTNDSSNEYEAIFVLKHEALYDGLREYFMSLMPKEQVHASGIIISQMRVYVGAEPLMEDGLGEEAEYIQLNGQRIKYQYGPNFLLHEMNKIRDQVIRESEAIRLSKPSAVLSSPYCK
ncbi:hypothetical protein AHAS_Ahas19G0211400 [Arachis hypogaea]